MDIQLIHVEASCPQSGTKYTGIYESDLLAGEVVRNVCVNLCLDPDTINGLTTNVTVSFYVTKLISIDASSIKKLLDDVQQLPFVRFKYNPHRPWLQQLQCEPISAGETLIVLFVVELLAS